MEKIRKFSDPPLTVCEKCGGELDQLLSSPAIQFKGAGWYVTDYAKKPVASTSAKDSSSSEKKDSTESKAETKSESKESSKPAEPAKAGTNKD
jgi:putative FmdB family regulatory protein